MLAPAFPMLFSCAGHTILRFSRIAEGLGIQCGPRRLTDVYFGEGAYVVVTSVGSVNAHRSRLRCAVRSPLGNRFNFPLLCAALVKIAAVAVLVCRGRALCAERIAPLPTLCGLCSTTIVLADLPGYQPWCSGR